MRLRKRTTKVTLVAARLLAYARSQLLVVALAVGTLLAPVAQAQACKVDLALVIALDVSGSVDAKEWDLERNGTARAFLDWRVIDAVRSGVNGRIAIAVTQWSETAHLAIDWRIVDGWDSAEDLAAEIAGMPRLGNNSTWVGSAVMHALALFRDTPCAPLRLTIDLSSDGQSNGGTPPKMARAAAIDADAQINALLIQDLTEPNLEAWYQENIVTGFIILAEDFAAYADALRRKLVLEIAGARRDTTLAEVP